MDRADQAAPAVLVDPEGRVDQGGQVALVVLADRVALVGSAGQDDEADRGCLEWLSWPAQPVRQPVRQPAAPSSRQEPEICRAANIATR